MRQKSILLSLVKAMNFVNEKHSTSLQIPVDFRTLDDGLDISFFRSDRGELDEISLKFLC